MIARILISRRVAEALLLVAGTALLPLGSQAQTKRYLGRLSSNPYAADSTSNRYGSYGSRYSSLSVNNPYGTYGNPYSAYGATNPYTNSAPKLYGSDGTYLGKLSANPYDPESVSNPLGRYGSPYSSTSIHNQFGVYGSRYSPFSSNNPFGNSGPVIVSDR